MKIDWTKLKLRQMRNLLTNIRAEGITTWQMDPLHSSWINTSQQIIRNDNVPEQYHKTRQGQQPTSVYDTEQMGESKRRGQKSEGRVWNSLIRSLSRGLYWSDIYRLSTSRTFNVAEEERREKDRQRAVQYRTKIPSQVSQQRRI